MKPPHSYKLAIESGLCFGPLVLVWMFGVISFPLTFYSENADLSFYFISLLIFISGICGVTGIVMAVRSLTEGPLKRNNVNLAIIFLLIGACGVLASQKAPFVFETGRIMLFWLPLIACAHFIYMLRSQYQEADVEQF